MCIRDRFQALDKLVREHGSDLLGDSDARRHRMMSRFAAEISNILATVADILQPRSSDDLDDYGFNDDFDD